MLKDVCWGPSHASPLTKKFVAVGIGPLNCHEYFMENCDEPHPNLTGGMRFLAEWMHLRGPPLDLVHKDEFTIFNDFMRANPSRPTKKTWIALAKLFKLKADYSTTFPKLPSMLARHCLTWKMTQEIVLAKETMRGPCCELLCKLARPPRGDEVGAAARFQREATNQQLEEDDIQQTPTESVLVSNGMFDV